MVYTSMVSSGTAVPRVVPVGTGVYYSRMDGSGEFTRISIQSVSWVEGVLRQLVPYGPPTPATIPIPYYLCTLQSPFMDTLLLGEGPR